MRIKTNSTNQVLILGAGLAGLTAAQVLSGAGLSLTLLERDKSIGGLARTMEQRGFRFDLGGHRFITDDLGLEHFVRKLLGDDCLTVPRSSKIVLRKRYFDYPLKPVNAMSGFGPLTSSAIIFDYIGERLRASFSRQQTPVSLEDWVVQKFGRRMFDIYFRDYSEKVWGIDCKQIDMRWVEHRIQGLSLAGAVTKALLPWAGKQLPTLSREFLYPKLGIGQIADKLACDICMTNQIHTGSYVVGIHHSQYRITSIDVEQHRQQQNRPAQQFISTIPLPALVRALRPLPPSEVLAAASRLRSRDLITVSIMLNREQITEHTWIYIPERHIPFGRIHEPTNWSRAMAPAGHSLLVTEYFCFQNDRTWAAADADLVQQTVTHLVKLGFIQPHEVIDSAVTRIANAYPLFEIGYHDDCQIIHDYLDRFTNLYLAGRGGMFRYYNMDHAMQAGWNTAQAIIRNSTSQHSHTAAPWKMMPWNSLPVEDNV